MFCAYQLFREKLLRRVGGTVPCLWSGRVLSSLSITREPVRNAEPQVCPSPVDADSSLEQELQKVRDARRAWEALGEWFSRLEAGGDHQSRVRTPTKAPLCEWVWCYCGCSIGKWQTKRGRPEPGYGGACRAVYKEFGFMMKDWETN